MTNYLYLCVALLFLTACDSTVTSLSNDGNIITDETKSTSNNTSTLTNDDYITSIPNDTIKNTAVSLVPHKKSFIPMLGILINYNNIHITSSVSSWSTKLFGKNEHQLNHYYAEVSNSKFEFKKANETNGITNDGIVTVTLNKNHPNTDIDSYDFDLKMHPDLMDSLKVIDKEIDFSNYDSDANGHITPDELLLTFIIAGYEDSYQGYHVTNGVWGHQSCVNNEYSPTVDGVTLMNCLSNGNFAMFGERHDIHDSHDATIGIIAHELGHSAFSLPDLYNTSGDEGGIGSFGLMGAGVWTRQSPKEEHGNTPTHFSAWSKIYMGWVTPMEESGSATLVESASDSYNIIKIPISANNYYLLENRNNYGYDKGLYSLDGVFDGGIAIWHINENKLTTENFLENNVNNNVNNKGVDLVEAQNTYIDYNRDGGEKALFYSPHIDSFGTKITNISTRDSVMNLNIN